MDFSSAINLKNAISSSFLNKSQPSAAIISFSMATAGPLPAASHVRKSILTDVNAVGVSEKQSGDN